MSLRGCRKAYGFSASLYVNKERNHDQKISYLIWERYWWNMRETGSAAIFRRRGSDPQGQHGCICISGMAYAGYGDYFRGRRFKPDTDAAGYGGGEGTGEKSFAHWHEYNMYHKEGWKNLLGN